MAGPRNREMAKGASMRIGRSASFRTFSIEWNRHRPRIILGARGMDRPSVQWHLTKMWRKWRYRRAK